jgi:aspartyl-tRNA(Asn)/glutamyl-tRNA(Gln) amidotransferase subunit B
VYQSFIGLEVHIHLLTATKVFCGCRSAFGDEPNSNVCPVCMGYPGVLPTLNLEAMRMGCMVAKALNCRIPERTWFERKQYFYPDMTKNYQISQFASPLGQNGWLELEGRGADGKRIGKKVRIKECHLEEDAGKMIHTGTVSLLDYNRAGVSLLEIVTEPDMETGEEAECFIQQLRRMVRYLGVCDGNMEEGSLRADANVSINLPGRGLGKKVEIKNLNSSRFVRLGLNYEIRRQAEVLDEGKAVTQETRLWNENRDETVPMRQKENAQDYRYFPEPDLPVFCPDGAFLGSVEDALVELPAARLKRFSRAAGSSTRAFSTDSRKAPSGQNTGRSGSGK